MPARPPSWSAAGLRLFYSSRQVLAVALQRQRRRRPRRRIRPCCEGGGADNGRSAYVQTAPIISYRPFNISHCLLNDVALNQVLVRFRPRNGDDAATDDLTQKVIARVQDEGTCWVGGTNWRGQVAMLVSIFELVNHADDIDRSPAAIIDALDGSKLTRLDTIDAPTSTARFRQS